MSRNALQEQELKYSLSWLKQNTGLPIKDSLDENFHSFYVFTKEHKQYAMDALIGQFKNIMKYAKEGVAKYTTDKKLVKIYPQVKIGCESDKLLEESLKDVPTKIFRVDSLDEIKNIVQNLDI